MKAIGLDSYGGPEVLHPIDLPDRHAGPGEVRIQVAAAAVAPVDSMLRTGLLSGAYAGLKPPFVPGMEVAGVVDELGEGVEVASELTLGDRVVGFVDTGGTHGGYSDHVVLPAASVTPAPAGSTDAEAASFLNNALTARNALDALALPVNSTLVVTGAAGSVGGYLTELGAFEGLRVIGIAAAGDEELVRSFGASGFVARGDDVAERVRALAPEGVDAVADSALLGDAIVQAIRGGGQIALFRPWSGRPERDITACRLNVRQRAQDHAAITRIRELVEAGVLSLRVATTLPALDAPEAHRLLDAGGTRGRIILEFPVGTDLAGAPATDSE